MAVSELYAPLIERDLDAIPAAVAEFLKEHSVDDLFLAIGRFAVLAFAPSEHSRHALVSVLSAHEVRDELGERWPDLLIECARYVAETRQPWSEPPILDPPEFDPAGLHDADALRSAVATRDRLAGERWLAARVADADVMTDLFAVASDDFEDYGHKLLVAVAAESLTSILGERGRYAALRVAIWNLLSAQSGTFTSRGVTIDSHELLRKLIAIAVNESGSIESAHSVFLFDAALETRDARVIERAMDYLDSWSTAWSSGFTASQVTSENPLPVYRLARDYGALLRGHAVAPRLAERFPDAPIEQFIHAVAYNLAHGPSFEEWSFA